MTVKLIESKCQGILQCGECIKSCVPNMMTASSNLPKPKILGCADCGLCIKACPNGAIVEKTKIT